MISFFDHLETLRRKPETERRRLAFIYALVLTLIIAGLWLVGLRIRAFFLASVNPEASGSFWREARMRIVEGWQVIKGYVQGER